MASKVLKTAIYNGQMSTAKSGSIMAFEDTVMTKTMTEKEASTLLSILDAYISYFKEPGNLPDVRSNCHGSLLPRFYGAYVYREERHHLLFHHTKLFVIMANVFAGVPPDMLKLVERFDLKGSAEDRTQRREGDEFMDFDLLRKDRKFVPVVPAEGGELLEQLERDVHFMVSQHMSKGPLGIIDYDLLPEFYTGQAGLMDYSLVLALVSHDTPGGLVRLKVRDEHMELD